MSGIADVTGNAILTAAHGGTAITFATPIKLLFLTTVRTFDDTTDTEWSTAAGYVAGTGFSGVTYSASATVAHIPTQASSNAAQITNSPAGTWAGCVEADSSGTIKKLWYGALTGGSKTVNLGDTCTVPSTSLSDTLQ